MWGSVAGKGYYYYKPELWVALDGVPDGEVSLEEHAVHEMYDAVRTTYVRRCNFSPHAISFYIHILEKTKYVQNSFLRNYANNQSLFYTSLLIFFVLLRLFKHTSTSIRRWFRKVRSFVEVPDCTFWCLFVYELYVDITHASCSRLFRSIVVLTYTNQVVQE